MSPRRTFALVLRNFYLLRGSLARVVPLFAWVTIDIVLWGFMTRYLNSVTAAGFDFVPALLGAVLMWDFFGRVMMGVVTAFLEDVWARNFLNVFSTPLTLPEYVGGLVLSTIATSSVGLVVMLVLASVAFGLSFLGYGIAIVPFLLVLFLFGVALGLVACGLVLWLGPAAEWFVWPIPALISPFAAVFYPLSALPEWMQVIARALPPVYVFENMRSLVRGGAVSATDLLAALLLAVAWTLLTAWFFVRVYRHAVRTGLIARFSAETLS